jgi:methyltransferase (TIGR00027 family)
MEKDGPSISAMGSAVLRAAHVKEDPLPWVLEDTVSASFLGANIEARIERSMTDWPDGVRAAFRLSHVVRARLAEDEAIAGIDAGRRNYVILGAGLDSFALRHPRAHELTIWEIDHPNTQRWKRDAYRRTNRAEPANVRFFPIDLSINPLSDIDLPALATWNWLGVTMYLERAATASTLRAIASSDAGTVLVVNFVLAELDGFADRMESTAARVLQNVGEPVLATYSRSEVEELLKRTGFSDVQVFDGVALTNRYLRGRPDLQLPNTTLIAVATV